MKQSVTKVMMAIAIAAATRRRCDSTKDQILPDLSVKTEELLWSEIVFCSLTVGFISYSVASLSSAWLLWKEQRARQQNVSNRSDVPPRLPADKEPKEVSDGELCVVCLIRRRRFAFIPCGHLVCCQQCALKVERAVSPKCPVCRQSIRSSVRIYDSCG